MDLLELSLCPRKAPGQATHSSVRGCWRRSEKPVRLGLSDAVGLCRLSFEGACRTVVNLVERFDSVRNSVHYDI